MILYLYFYSYHLPSISTKMKCNAILQYKMHNNSKNTTNFADKNYNMDYTKLPAQLIYRTRKSLEEFTNNNEMNECIVDNMLDIPYLQSSDFKDRTTACFNAAYYICTLILVDDHPEWSLPRYCNIALCNKKDNIAGQAITLSLVRIYLIHFGSDWHDKHQKLVDKLDAFLRSHWIEQGYPLGNDYSYKDAFHQLNSFEVATAPFSPTEFALRKIDNETIEEMQIAQFTWTQFTDYYKHNIMLDIVFHVGKTEEEMILLLESLRHDAEMFYTKDNPYYESVCNRLNGIEQDVYFHFHAAENEAYAQAEIENLQWQGDIRPYQACIAELESQINNSQQNGNDNPDYIESLNRQLADEKSKNVQLEEDVRQLKKVLELDKDLESDEKRLQIDERIIFVSTALGTPWNSDLTNQTQLAKIIEHFSGDDWHSIRSRIVAINKEMKRENTNPGDGLTQGTKEAVSNVIGWLSKATRGERNTPTTDELIKEIKDVFLNTME